jgi:hypothetical protein
MKTSMSLKDYYHRRNKDGGFDTVCLYCSALVGIADSEASLIHFESWHRCVHKERAASTPRNHDEKGDEHLWSERVRSRSPSAGTDS